MVSKAAKQVAANLPDAHLRVFAGGTLLFLLIVLGLAYMGLAYLFPEVMLLLAAAVVTPALLAFLMEWLDERK